MSERVTVRYSAGVADVRLSRPEKLNALDLRMFEDLIEAGQKLKTDRSLRAVVLSGEGSGFCAGLDMESFASISALGDPTRAVNTLLGSRAFGDANQAQYAALVWREIPVPVIAAVHGVAFGGGLQIALGADIRIVAIDSKLSVMEMKWGLIPDMGGMALMRPLLRDDVMRDLVFTGRVIDGSEACAIGLATRVSADPFKEAFDSARRVADLSPHALRAAKRVLNLPVSASIREILSAESEEQRLLFGSPNQREAVRANMERRAPKFADAD